MAGTYVTDIMKALDDAQAEKNKGMQPQEPQSVFIDPFNALNYIGPRQKPGPVSYALLRYMSGVPAVAAIINTRLNQMANFTRRPRNDKDTGFRITTKDPDKKMDDGMQAQARNLENFFLKTGFVKNRKRSDNFNSIMRKLGRDTLTLDEVAIELVPGMNQRQYPITEMYAIDAALIEVIIPDIFNAEPNVYEPVTKHGHEVGAQNIAYVQRVQGQIVAEYSDEELIRAHRNPRTDIDFADFGYSELEQLLTIVTGIMNALSYNTTYFSQSNLPQGVLEIVGKYKAEHLEGFKRAWQTLISGSVGKQWKVPVMALEEGQGFKFTPFKQGNRDMEYSMFMEFLHNIACAVYQIDPREVGFKSWDSGGGSKTMDNDAPATTIENSKDKGFYPLMQFFADLFNEQVLDRIAPDFRFEWVGLDEDRTAQEWAMEKDQLAQGVLTPRMYWDKHDVDYDQYGYGDQEWIDVPPNQTLSAFVQSKMEQQGQMDMADQQHQQNMEATLVQGIQQGALQNSQQKHQMGLEQSKQQAQANLADQQHQNTMEANLHQGVQQQGLEGMKQQGQQKIAQMQHQQTLRQNMQQHGLGMAMEGHKAKLQGGLQDQQHQQAMEQQLHQGMQQQGLEGMKQKGQQQMAQTQHQHALRQNMQQAGLQRGAEAQKHGYNKEMADLQHQNTMEQTFAQGTQQQGLQNQKHEQGKEMAEMQLLQDLERLIAQGAQQSSMTDKQHAQKKDLATQGHQHALRQNMQQHGLNRAAETQKQRFILQQQAGAEKEQPKGQKKPKNNLNKGLEVDVLEILVEFVG